jgi:hypothetical protein
MGGGVSNIIWMVPKEPHAKSLFVPLIKSQSVCKIEDSLILICYILRTLSAAFVFQSSTFEILETFTFKATFQT